MKKLAMAVKVYVFYLLQYSRIYLLHFKYVLFFSQLMGSQGEDGASGSKNMMSSSFKEKNAIRDKMKKHFQLKIYYYYRKPGNKMAKNGNTK